MNRQPAPTRTADEKGGLPPLLAELEQVLKEEALALKKLDRDGIDRAAEHKSRLSEAIASAKPDLTKTPRAALERLRRSALRNHMLLAHARDSVRQVLGVASGRPASPVLGGLRLDVRG
jgi:flagellar biosynthesis/type III secretory pathway chaperone